MMNDRFRVYPVNISYESDDTDMPYLVTIPLFDGVTQGVSVADSMRMARDYIELVSCDWDPDDLPAGTTNLPVPLHPGDLVVLVGVDLNRYRQGIEVL
jgi:predicted RNase H-like HicB family nuclease